MYPTSWELFIIIIVSLALTGLICGGAWWICKRDPGGTLEGLENLKPEKVMGFVPPPPPKPPKKPDSITINLADLKVITAHEPLTEEMKKKLHKDLMDALTKGSHFKIPILESLKEPKKEEPKSDPKRKITY